MSHRGAGRHFLIGLGLVAVCARFVLPWHAVMPNTNARDWLCAAGICRNDVDIIVIHHTATPVVTNRGSIGVKVLEELHRERGWGIVCRGRIYYVAYHYVLTATGQVQAGRPEGCRGAHSGDGILNEKSIGIALVGDFEVHAPSPSQLSALVTLVSEVARRHNVPAERIVGHGEVRSGTVCPGSALDIPGIRSAVERRVLGRGDFDGQRAGNASR